RWRKPSVPAKWSSSAARAISYGKKGNPAGTSLKSANSASIATPTQFLCVSKRWVPASATKAIAVASFANWKRMARRTSPKRVRLHRKLFTGRRIWRKKHELSKARHSERQLAGRDARTFRARGLEDHAQLAQLCSDHR